MTIHKIVETAKPDSPPLYEVRELSLEEAMLLLAAEREEQAIKAAERKRSGPRLKPAAPSRK